MFRGRGVAGSEMSRREAYRQSALGIAEYLAARQQPDGGFPGPDNYGVAFAFWLWSYFGAQFRSNAERALRRMDREFPPTHGEFNAYALLHCRSLTESPETEALLRRVRFGRRHSANWMLLRAFCRAAAGSWGGGARGAVEARAAVARHRRRGLICDRPGVRSFGYHAFCGALLADLWACRRDRWAGRAAAQAAQFLLPFVLPNGDTLYLGRGQQQILGYGALIYLLEAAGAMAGESGFGEAAERVFGYLLRFRRADGSFPLVLCEGEGQEPWSPGASRAGWYSYNTYADYLPFLGCFLLKAAEAGPARLPEALSETAHPDLRVWRGPRYTAVLSRPGGPPTNDLSFPYVCVAGESLFPCYGGEDAGAADAVPLPWGVLAGGDCYGFGRRLRYRLTDAAVIGDSRLVHHTRSFIFQPDGFTCRDVIVFRRRPSFSRFVSANFLFRDLRPLASGAFESRCRGASAVVRMDPPGAGHADAAETASGRLVALRREVSPGSIRPGQEIASELRVEFP